VASDWKDPFINHADLSDGQAVWIRRCCSCCPEPPPPIEATYDSGDDAFHLIDYYFVMPLQFVAAWRDRPT